MFVTKTANDQDARELTSLVRNVQATTPFDNVTALTNFADQAQPPLQVKPLTITSEQAVENYNRSNPAKALDVIYPSVTGHAGGAGPQLDYPFTIITANSLKAQAAQQFRQVLTTAMAKSDVQQFGFRSAGGQAAPSDAQYGVIAADPRAMTAASPGEASPTTRSGRSRSSRSPRAPPPTRRPSGRSPRSPTGRLSWCSSPATSTRCSSIR